MNYAVTGTIAVLIWNIVQYFLKRNHSKVDTKTDETILKLNGLLEKTIDISSEISNHLNDVAKDVIVLLKEVSFSISFNNISDLEIDPIKFIEKINFESTEYSKKAVTKNRKSVTNFMKLTSPKIDKLTHSIELKANDLISMNLASLNIKQTIINKQDKLTYLIRKHIINRVIEDEISINLENIGTILKCAYKLEKEINSQLKKLNPTTL